jgi:hypothetical protein
VNDEKCFGTTAILPTFVEFLENLQHDPEWRASEVRLVEEGVRQILKRLSAAEKRGMAPDARYRKSA